MIPEIVINFLRSKELELKADRNWKESKNLFVRDRSITRQRNGHDSQSHQGNNTFKKKRKEMFRSKSINENRKCYRCEKTGHYIKDYFKKKNEKREK